MRKVICFVSTVLSLSLPVMAKDVMLMNRIGPTQSELYVANADGSGERKLFSTTGTFDYDANYSYDGKWIVFTSERNGLGQADLYRVHPDGTGLERLTDDPALDDQGALSPDSSQLAFVSTRKTWRANVWILDLKTKQLRNLTGAADVQGDPRKPDGFYRPQWSPDGKWIAFTSDRNTDWKGHDDDAGWEHLQELSVYVIHPDGTGLRRVTGPGIASGSPKWSADSKQIFYYELPVQGSWTARVSASSAHTTSQIISVNLDTGKRTDVTSGPGLKLSPQPLPDGRVGYETKSGVTYGILYTPETAKASGHTQSATATPSPAAGAPSANQGASKSPETATSPTWSRDNSPGGAGQAGAGQAGAGQGAAGGWNGNSQGGGAPSNGNAQGSSGWGGNQAGNASSEPKGPFPANMRSPSWSADGKHVVYQRIENTPHPQNFPLYSWDPNYDFRYTDVFPTFSKDGVLALTSKDVNSSIVTMNVDGTNQHLVYSSGSECRDHSNGPCGAFVGVAFAPSWSPDGQWLVFGVGGYLVGRNTSIAKIMMARKDGSDVTELTSGTPNAGFPSFSPDGKEVVYRSWGPNEDGLRILNVQTKKVRVLTDQLDNLPDWSVNNQIVFTRKSADNNFDIYTINPDGSDLKRLTDFPSSDAHAVWSYDGKKVMWNSAEYGFKDEAALYDNSFQPYGQIWVMDPDGSHKRPITDSRWEDSMPAYVPPNAK